MQSKNWSQRLALVGAVTVMSGVSALAADPTDITGVVTTIDGYRTAAMAVGILVLLFMLGRTIVRKIAK